MRRCGATVTTDEVGDAAVYLLSDMSRGVTAEILHVDAGYNIVGMKHPDAPDIDITVPQGVGGMPPAEPSMARPDPLFRPPRGNRLEPRSAGCRASTTSRSTRSAACRRRVAANSCASCSNATGRPLADYDYVSSPLGRARETMELMRAAHGP